MALHELLSLIPSEVASVHRTVVARWTETMGADLEPEPPYGAFVDEAGLVIAASQPARVFLRSDDPRHLVVEADLERSLDGCRVFFVDWGRQPLAWEEIFDLWEAWESQDMVAGCGAVAVAWGLRTRWTAPGWVAFRGDFDGAPLAVLEREVAGPAPEAAREAKVAEPLSFLAKARRLRGDEPAAGLEEALPMVPFTIESLKDPRHPWPAGAA